MAELIDLLKEKYNLESYSDLSEAVSNDELFILKEHLENSGIRKLLMSMTYAAGGVLALSAVSRLAGIFGHEFLPYLEKQDVLSYTHLMLPALAILYQRTYGDSLNVIKKRVYPENNKPIH